LRFRSCHEAEIATSVGMVILIERLLGRQFGGTAKFEFARVGLLFRAAFPVPIAAEPADEAFGAGLTKR
jgi:hypothetical protein